MLWSAKDGTERESQSCLMLLGAGLGHSLPQDSSAHAVALTWLCPEALVYDSKALEAMKWGRESVGTVP